MSVTMKAKDDAFHFTFKGAHPTIVNAVRRTVLDDVPCFAIEDVEIVSNETPLYDETVAHRLGLIPLSSDLKSYNFKQKCTCGGIGCALCEVKLSVSADSEGYVYSSELKSDDPNVAPVDAEIPITKLFAGKKFAVNCRAVLGTGKEHAKWAPAHSYLKEEGKDIELIIEPFGQLGAKEIYNKAVDVLIEKIDELGGQL